MERTGHSEEEAFYTLKEAAELLHIGRRTLRRLLAQGKMEGYKVGRQWRIAKPLPIEVYRPPDTSPTPSPSETAFGAHDA